MPFLLCLQAVPANWKRLLLAGFLGGWLLASGFRVQAGSSSYLIDVWDNEKGLPSSSVTSLAQTPEGYLWVGTYSGLERFDGVRFVNFDPFNTPELKYERIRFLFTDVNGTLWINMFDGSMATWRKGVFTRESGWPGGLTTMITSCSNMVAFVIPGLLVERLGGADEPSRWRQISLAGGISGHNACQDAAGDIWYITLTHRLGRIQGDHSEVMTNDPGLPDQRVNFLEPDSAGRLWVGTDNGLVRWDGRHFEDQTPTGGEPLKVSFMALNHRNECWVYANGHLRLCRDRAWIAEATEWQDLPKAYAASLSGHEDQAGGTWFCHFGKGLLWAGSNGELRTITSSNGLAGNRITSWLQDHEGNIWVGADRGGLSRIRERQFNVITVGDDSSSRVAMSVCEDTQGAVWIGSMGGGLTRCKDDKLFNYPLASMANKGSIFAAIPDEQPGSLWLSADNEDLMRFENGQLSRPPWSVHGVKAMLRDRRGRFWLGMQNGLACYVDGKLKHLGTNDGFQRSDVRVLAEDRQGNVWAGTGDGDLYRFGNEGVKAGAVANGVAYHTTDRWERQPVWSLCVDADNTIWAGTFRGGLLRFKDGHFTRYTEEQGLPNEVVCQILPDHQGNLWLGTYGGIFRAARADLDALARGRTNSISWVTYGLLAGLPSLECSGGYQPSGWVGADGRLWFSTLKGVVSVQPNDLSNSRQAPPVLVEEVIVDGRSVHLPVAAAGPDAVHPVDVEIGPGKHYVEFHYTGLSFTAPEQVRFRYRLRGLDDQWVEAGTRRSAQYTFLRPGDYNFEVMACNNEGLWNEQPGALTLRIEPHVWETWWFFLTLGFCLAVAIAMVARNMGVRKLRRQMERLEQQQAIERDRARIARDIHDDLGAGLTQIGLLTELTRRAPPEALGGRLNQISETARELTGTMDEIVWAVDPQNDTLDCLAIYLCKFGQEYLSVAGIRCRLDVPMQLPPRPLTAESRHNLYLAVKETLNNIVKHARATEVWLKLIPAAATFTIVIQDNGRGFNAAGETAASPGRIAGGNGLANLEQRLAAIGGRALVKSTPGQGVVVELTVPFDDAVSPQMAISNHGANGTSLPPTNGN